MDDTALKYLLLIAAAYYLIDSLATRLWSIRAAKKEMEQHRAGGGLHIILAHKGHTLEDIQVIGSAN